jgi:hypothetical protein
MINHKFEVQILTLMQLIIQEEFGTFISRESFKFYVKLEDISIENP